MKAKVDAMTRKHIVRSIATDFKKTWEREGGFWSVTFCFGASSPEGTSSYKG